MSVADFLLALLAIFAAAKLFGELAERIGQPAVLGEMIGGIVIGVSGLRLINPADTTIHLLAELGVILLLFVIGLETDIHALFAAARSSVAVALVGIALPFLGGYFVGKALGMTELVSVFLGAALTATSVGITARVLSDLGHLHTAESNVILGAAVLDDIIGLIILSVVGGLAAGGRISVAAVAWVTAVAFGFVIAALGIGSLLTPVLIRAVGRLRVSRALFFGCIMFAFLCAWLAAAVGSALIIGAFAAGLVLARTERAKEIKREVHDAAQMFVPIFFVVVGAAVDLKTLNPLNAVSRRFLLIGLALTAVAIGGKFLAGYAASGRGLRKSVIGAGMVPRGEVGFIFAQMGLTTGILSAGLYSSVAMMVIATTFVTPPLLRALLPARDSDEICDANYATDAPSDEVDESGSPNGD